MKVQRVTRLGPLGDKGRRNTSTPQVATIKTKSNPKRVVPWLRCPKCNGMLSRQVLSKEFREGGGGCKCRGSRVVIKYKYFCTQCDYSEARTA